MNKKQLLMNGLMLASLILPALGQAKVAADSFYDNQTNAQRADITNWVASTPDQISQNLSVQRIDKNQLNGQRYVIQWGDTLWGISQATGISIEKLAYDNGIVNIDLINAGDVLILNRDGQVPVDYSYKGDGREVAKSSVVINNYIDNSSTVVIVNNTAFYDNSAINHNYPAETATPQDIQSAAQEVADTQAGNENQAALEMTEESSPVASSSDASSSDASSSSKKTTNSSSSQVQMSQDDFTDAVQEELSQGYYEDSGHSINFYSSDSIRPDSDSDSLYDHSIDLSLKSTDYTQENVERVAKAIYEELKEKKDLDTLVKATGSQLSLTKSGNKLSFNVTLYQEDDTDESSSSSSSSEFDDSSSYEDKDVSSYDDDSSEPGMSDSQDYSVDSDE